MIHGHGGNVHGLAERLGCRTGEIVDVSSNINPLGPPPGLMEYLSRHVTDICSLLDESLHACCSKHQRHQPQGSGHADRPNGE